MTGKKILEISIVKVGHCNLWGRDKIRIDGIKYFIILTTNMFWLVSLQVMCKVAVIKSNAFTQTCEYMKITKTVLRSNNV